MSGAGDSPRTEPKTAVGTSESEHIPDNRQSDLGFPPELRELIAVERERIESTNRRTEVARYAIQTSDASDKRQFDFQMAQLELQKDSSSKRFVLVSVILVVSSVSGIGFFGILLWMLFWGSPLQSDGALAILKTLATGIGGYGVIGGVTRAGRALMDRRN